MDCLSLKCLRFQMEFIHIGDSLGIAPRNSTKRWPILFALDSCRLCWEACIIFSVI